MDKFKKYTGVLIFIALVVFMLYTSYTQIMPKYDLLKSKENEVLELTNNLNQKNEKLRIVKDKIKKIKDSILTSQKKIYAPVESDLGNETLFFTLYNDIIEMIHANKIKIRSIDYKYNPENDPFVKFGRDAYFVCDVDMELVSNYVDLGKLVQDLYQYAYYVKINSLDVVPYQKDKKVLITKLSLRLYAKTEPEDIAQPAIKK